jgi:hypothetical protein
MPEGAEANLFFGLIETARIGVTRDFPTSTSKAVIDLASNRRCAFDAPSNCAQPVKPKTPTFKFVTMVARTSNVVVEGRKQSMASWINK